MPCIIHWGLCDGIADPDRYCWHCRQYVARVYCMLACKLETCRGSACFVRQLPTMPWIVLHCVELHGQAVRGPVPPDRPCPSRGPCSSLVSDLSLASSLLSVCSHRPSVRQPPDPGLLSAGEGGFSYTEYFSITYGVVAYALTAVFALALAVLQSAWVQRQIHSRLPSGVPRDLREWQLVSQPQYSCHCSRIMLADWSTPALCLLVHCRAAAYANPARSKPSMKEGGFLIDILPQNSTCSALLTVL